MLCILFIQSQYFVHIVYIYVCQVFPLMLKQVFFMIMFVSTVGTSKLWDPRDAWHSGWWFAKIVLWIALTILTFFIPSTIIRLYGMSDFSSIVLFLCFKY